MRSKGAADDPMAAVTVSREATIPNALGLHARAAARFVQAATRFASSIRVHPSTAFNGVRSSCDTVARNSSLR